MPNFVVELLKKNMKKINKKKFLLLGAAYKNNISDTRNSPSENIYNFLKKKSKSKFF